jgi:hypothetical protein
MLLARFAFQACSFNHSDISPSLKSVTYANIRRADEVIAP